MASAAKSRTTVINDAAQYIVEPKDFWIRRLPARLAEQAPRVVDLGDGSEAWSFDGGAWVDPLGLEVAAGRDPSCRLKTHYRYDDLRPGLHESNSRLEDMDLDGIRRTSIFPTFGLNVLNIRDDEVHRAAVRAYNDGLVEWCDAGDPGRLVPHALIPVTGLDDALTELNRVIALGCRGIIFGGWPSGGRTPEPADDKFWARCAEAGIVVHLIRGGPGNPERATRERSPASVGRYMGGTGKPGGDGPIELLVADLVTTKNANLSWMVLTGVLERFPAIKIVVVQAGAGWLAACGELLDWNFRYAQWVPGNGFARLKDLPSDYLRRQVLCTVEGDQHHLDFLRERGRSEMVLWASVYPTSMSSWPASGVAVDRQCEGVSDAVKAALVAENYVRSYGIVGP